MGSRRLEDGCWRSFRDEHDRNEPKTEATGAVRLDGPRTKWSTHPAVNSPSANFSCTAMRTTPFLIAALLSLPIITPAQPGDGVIWDYEHFRSNDNGPLVYANVVATPDGRLLGLGAEHFDVFHTREYLPQIRNPRSELALSQPLGCGVRQAHP